MATQAQLNELADALIESYIVRLELKAELARKGVAWSLYHDPWDYIDQKEFISQAEWLQLKKALKIEDDKTLSDRIFNGESFKSRFLRRFTFIAFSIVIDAQSRVGYCTIKMVDRTR